MRNLQALDRADAMYAKSTDHKGKCVCLHVETSHMENYHVLFVWVEVLRPSQLFFSNVGTFSWVEPVLSNEDEVSCSRTHHRTTGGIRTFDLAIKGPALYQLS